MANSEVSLRASQMPQMVENLPFGAVEGLKGAGKTRTTWRPLVDRRGMTRK